MSLASKITLGVSIVFTSGMVYYVHTKQQSDRESLREGVVKDLQRQEAKKMQNIKDLQAQQELKRALKSETERLKQENAG